MSIKEYKLSVFEGPLDLLLHLVSKHKLNIYDIEIMELIDQYLDFLDKAEFDADGTAEFVEVAAQLIYLKSVSLLPGKEEAEKLKKELEGRLIEYSLTKIAAARLKEMYLDIPFTVKQPMDIEIDPTYDCIHFKDELLLCYLSLMKAAKKEQLTSGYFFPFVTKRFVSVTARMTYVLAELYEKGEADIGNMFAGVKDRSERVATFLAILELTRNGRILLSDDNSRIYMNPDHESGGNEGSQFDIPTEDTENDTYHDLQER